MPPTPSALVVDDDENVRVLVSVMLTRAGYAVRSFAGPYEAISAAHDCPPDIYVLDVRLPEMNGRDLCRTLKALRRTCRPVLMISAESTETDIAEARAAGCDEFLAKPFRRAELVGTLDQLRR